MCLLAVVGSQGIVVKYTAAMFFGMLDTHPTPVCGMFVLRVVTPSVLLIFQNNSPVHFYTYLAEDSQREVKFLSEGNNHDSRNRARTTDFDN